MSAMCFAHGTQNTSSHDTIAQTDPKNRIESGSGVYTVVIGRWSKASYFLDVMICDTKDVRSVLMKDGI